MLLIYRGNISKKSVSKMCSLLVSSPEKDYFREDFNERSPTYIFQSVVVCFLLNVFFLECVKTLWSMLFLNSVLLKAFLSAAVQN